MRKKFALLFHGLTVNDMCFRFIYAITALGLLVPLASLLFVGEEKRWFAWYVLFMPALWCVWTIYAIIWSNRYHIFRLIFLWLLIDFSALVFLISFSMGMEHWEKTNGADIVLYMMYFPVVVPLIKIMNSEFMTAIINLGQSCVDVLPISKREVMVIWLEMSLLAAFQSVIVVSTSLLLKKCYTISRLPQWKSRN